jgi:putative transposase
VVVALAIAADGTKLPVELWEGLSENKTVAHALLADLVERGLNVEEGAGRHRRYEGARRRGA